MKTEDEELTYAEHKKAKQSLAYKRRDELEAEIESLKTKLDKYKEPYDGDTIISGDVGNGIGYLEGHAWVGRVKANTKYTILVIEDKKLDMNQEN